MDFPRLIYSARRMHTMFRWAAVGSALLVFGACGPCGGSTSLSSSPSSANGCGHPGLCLTLSGPLSGATSGLVLAPDCIPGGGLDAEFTTNVGGHETSIDILVTDTFARSSPGFKPGTFAIKPSREVPTGTAFASIYVKPDKDLLGYPSGWSTDRAGSSGTVTIGGDENGKVLGAVVAPAGGVGASLHIDGSFNCR